MSWTGWLPLLLITLAVVLMAKFGGLKIWHATALLLFGIYIGLSPLTGSPISSFLTQATKGAFP